MTTRFLPLRPLLIGVLGLTLTLTGCGDEEGVATGADTIEELSDATGASDELSPDTSHGVGEPDANDAPEVSGEANDDVAIEQSPGDIGDAPEEGPDSGASADESDVPSPPTDTPEDTPAVFTLASFDFEDGGEMPEAFACCLGNPALSWSGAPEGTQSFALIFDDPDAGGFAHWAVYNIPADVSGLDAGISGKAIEAALPEGASELDNGFGFPGYLGSCPPENHTYRWRLWALSGTLDTAPVTFSALEAQAGALALSLAELTHTFGPKTPEQGATCDD